MYTHLSIELASDYDTIKETILKSYRLVPEAYCQRFQILVKEEGQTYVEFARTKEQLFDQWCTPKRSLTNLTVLDSWFLLKNSRDVFMLMFELF